MQPDDIVPMGKVVGAFGILGWLKIKTDTEEDDSLGKYSSLLIQINNKWNNFKVEKFFAKNDIFHVKVEGIADRDQALSLKGSLVGISRGEFPKLPENEYYWADLIGLTVYNQSQELIGKVTSLMDTGANGVLVITNADKEYLIPFVDKYIISVDSTQIIVDWGLDY